MRLPNRNERRIGPAAVALSLAVSLASLTGCVTETANETTNEPEPADGNWTIGTRTVPVPFDISDALRQSLLAAPLPDVEARRSTFPQNEQEWREDQLASNQASLDEISEQLGLSIERDEIDGVPVYRVAPQEPDPQQANHLFLHVHGGAYVFGGGDASVREAALVSAMTGIRALAVDYRMPPDHPFPAAVDDVATVYRHLLGTRSSKSIAIGGTSAGGGLSLAAVHRFIELGLATPGAIYAGTPWADLTKTGDTMFTNEGLDRILVAYEGRLEGAAHLYAGSHDLKNPLISPVYGDFTGFPPTYLVTGTRDLFLSDTARTHRKLRSAGVVADLNVYEGHSHADYLVVPRSTETLQVFSELDAFLLTHLSPRAGSG